MKKSKVGFIMIGLILVSSFILLQKDDFPDVEKELIKKAIKIEEEEIWPSFDMKAYPIEIRENDNAYLFYEGEVIKRQPALPVLAATAYKVNGQIEVFMPSKDTMENLGNLMQDSNQSPSLISNAFSLTGMKLSDHQYIALLYHEIFHGFQMNYYEDEIFGSIPDDFYEQETYEHMQLIKEDEVLYELYLNQNRVLYDVIKEVQPMDSYIEAKKAYIEGLNRKFDKDVVENIIYLETYYEKIEGTAKYVELKTLFALDEKQLYNQYIEDIKEDIDGREKYMRSGMGLCLLLDRYLPDWKAQVFNSSLSLYEMMIKNIND